MIVGLAFPVLIQRRTRPVLTRAPVMLASNRVVVRAPMSVVGVTTEEVTMSMGDCEVPAAVPEHSS